MCPIITTPSGELRDQIEFSIIFTINMDMPNFLKPLNIPNFDEAVIKESVHDKWKGHFNFVGPFTSARIKNIAVFSCEKRDRLDLGYVYILCGDKKNFVESRLNFVDGFKREFDEKCWLDFNTNHIFAIKSDTDFDFSTHVVLSGLLRTPIK